MVISEINYHPSDPNAAALAIEPTIGDKDLEFVEIHNPTGSAVNMTDWRSRGEVDFDFTSSSMNAGASWVVVSFLPTNTVKLAAFRAHNGISSSVVILGPFTGTLSNSAGRVTLQQPDAPPAGQTAIPHVAIDEVVYDDLLPWADADGSGNSLNRLTANSNGNAADSWNAVSPTPGSSNLTAAAPKVVNAIRDSGGELVRPDRWSTLTVQFDADVIVVASDLILINRTLGGTQADLTGIQFSYDATTLTGNWTFISLTTKLPAAFYRVVLNSQDTISRVVGGQILDGDGDGIAGGQYSVLVYQAIPGDANLDGDVDVADFSTIPFQNVGDFSIVKTNLGVTSGATWATGDFNGDGDVDVYQIDPATFSNVGDLSVLYSNLGRDVKPSGGNLRSGPVGNGSGDAGSLASKGSGNGIASYKVGLASTPVSLVVVPDSTIRKTPIVKLQATSKLTSNLKLAEAVSQPKMQIESHLFNESIDRTFANFDSDQPEELATNLAEFEGPLKIRLDLI